MQLGNRKSVAIKLLLYWLALRILDALWDNVFRPLIALNVEQWAVRHGFDQKLNRALETPGVGHVMTFVAEIASAVYGFATSGYALAFIAGCAFIAFFDWLAWPFSRLRRIAGRDTNTGIARQKLPDEPMRTALAEFFASKVEPAYEEAHALLHRLVSALNDSGGERRLIGSLVSGHVLDADRYALAIFRNSLDAADGQSMQAAFGECYEKYQWLSTWIWQCGVVLDFLSRTDPHYQRWRALDRELLLRLRELTARREFETLRARVRQVGWGEGVRAALDEAERGVTPDEPSRTPLP